MPSEVFEEPLEIEVDILEAGAPTASSYPYPSLARTGRSEKRTFPSIILENPYLRAVVVPTLGGRILSLFDKRTSTEVLPAHRMLATGRRGVRMIGGIELHLDGSERLTALASCQFAAHETEEGEPAVLWLAEAVTGTGLSWHLRISLQPDKAELEIEARVFNRTFRAAPYNAGLLLPDFEYSASGEDRLIAHTNGNGMACFAADCQFANLQFGAPIADSQRVEQLQVTRFATARLLAPRQTDTWRVFIQPVSQMPSLAAAGEVGAISIEGERLRIQASAPVEGHKLVFLANDGRTLESPLAVRPEHSVDFELPAPPAAIAILDPGKRAVLQWNGPWGRPETRSESPEPLAPPAADWRSLERRAARFDVATRHAVRILDAYEQIRGGEIEAAGETLEQALLYDGEDHLTWWSKAVVARTEGAEGESPELLNAHFLAPLEPALRAESFLAQPKRMEKEPSPLLKSMADHPEHFVEVACLLLEAGWYEQAVYWIDEALRHEEIPMLRYLLAYTHLTNSRMEYEAAAQLEAAARSPLAPPFPWREGEWEALEVLSRRFPQDSKVSQWAAMKAFARP